MKVAPKDMYMTVEEFDHNLESSLIIMNEPTKRQPYYVCEQTYESEYKAGVFKRIVHVYIIKY